MWYTLTFTTTRSTHCVNQLTAVTKLYHALWKVATWCTIPWVHVFLPGPAKSLFEKPYFENMKAALRPGGIISSMGKQDVVGGCGLALITPHTVKHLLCTAKAGNEISLTQHVLC